MSLRMKLAHAVGVTVETAILVTLYHYGYYGWVFAIALFTTYALRFEQILRARMKRQLAATIQMMAEQRCAAENLLDSSLRLKAAVEGMPIDEIARIVEATQKVRPS